MRSLIPTISILSALLSASAVAQDRDGDWDMSQIQHVLLISIDAMSFKRSCSRLTPNPRCRSVRRERPALPSNSDRQHQVYLSIAPMLALIDGFDSVPVIVSGIPRMPAGAAFGCRKLPTIPPTAFMA